MVALPLNYPPVLPPDQPNWKSYLGECQNVTFDGNIFDLARSPTVFKTFNAVVITASTALWTPTAVNGVAKKFRLLGGVVSIGVAQGNVLLQDGVGGSTIFIVPNQPLTTALYIGPFGNGILSGAAGNALAAIGASTATISGTLWGTEE